jgi:hypothetical protein
MAPMMVEALLNGQKNQTRRLVREGNSVTTSGEYQNLLWPNARSKTLSPQEQCLSARCEIADQLRTVEVRSALAPGALFWVREGQAGKRATRAGSRITLRVTHIAVERLRTIGDLEAIAEGVHDLAAWPEMMLAELPTGKWKVDTESARAHDWLVAQMPKRQREEYLISQRFIEIAVRGTPTPRDAFAVLWELINGPGSWEANPWVWVYRFQGVRMNIDRVLKVIKAGGDPYGR